MEACMTIILVSTEGMIPMRKYCKIPVETDQKLRKSGKISNIITFNGQGHPGKTTQAKGRNPS